jgi:hypothetical protein
MYNYNKDFDEFNGVIFYYNIDYKNNYSKWIEFNLFYPENIYLNYI